MTESEAVYLLAQKMRVDEQALGTASSELQDELPESAAVIAKAAGLMAAAISNHNEATEQWEKR